GSRSAHEQPPRTTPTPSSASFAGTGPFKSKATMPNCWRVRRVEGSAASVAAAASRTKTPLEYRDRTAKGLPFLPHILIVTAHAREDERRRAREPSRRWTAGVRRDPAPRVRTGTHPGPAPAGRPLPRSADARVRPA